MLTNIKIAKRSARYGFNGEFPKLDFTSKTKNLS